MLKWFLLSLGITVALLAIRLIPRSARSLLATGPSANALVYRAGIRVTVSERYHWAQAATGTVAVPPGVVRSLARNWRGVQRVVEGVQGPLTFYWVNFDVPQFDSDDDGPYIGAEIDAAFLEPCSGPVPVVNAIVPGEIQAVWYENEQLGKRVEFKAFVAQ